MSRALNYHLQSEAQTLVAVARLNGALSRPEACAACGAINPKAGQAVVWHHHDYAKPLDLIALCRSCHGKVHAGSIPEPGTGRTYPKRDYSHEKLGTLEDMSKDIDGSEAEEFGRAIKVGRAENGLTQKQLAEALTVSGYSSCHHAVVSSWERGARLPSLTSYVRMCALFGWVGDKRAEVDKLVTNWRPVLQGGTP